LLQNLKISTATSKASQIRISHHVTKYYKNNQQKFIKKMLKRIRKIIILDD